MAPEKDGTLTREETRDIVCSLAVNAGPRHLPSVAVLPTVLSRPALSEMVATVAHVKGPDVHGHVEPARWSPGCFLVAFWDDGGRE